MKIAHIITRLIIGGAQENTVLCCEDLVRDYGDEVLLLTGPTEGPEGSLAARLAAGVGDGRRVQVEITPTLCREISPLSDTRAYRDIVLALKRFSPDVVHTHSAKAGVLGRLAAWRIRVPRIVHTVHGAPFWDSQSWLGRRFHIACEWWAARHCHTMISVADAMTETMVAAKIAPRDKFITIRSGMDVKSFLGANEYRSATRQRFGFTDGDIVVGKVARLFPLKGHDDLLLAMRDAVKRCPRLRCLLVGDGILADVLRRDAERLGIADRVVFAGLVPPSEIPAVIAATDIVVHTSLREGLARVLPQAMLTGRPVVSYDIDGAREVVRDGKTGFLLSPRDVSGLVTRILQLANDAALRNQLGNAGCELCREIFDHHAMTAAIRAEYTKSE